MIYSVIEFGFQMLTKIVNNNKSSKGKNRLHEKRVHLEIKFNVHRQWLGDVIG